MALRWLTRWVHRLAKLHGERRRTDLPGTRRRVFLGLDDGRLSDHQRADRHHLQFLRRPVRDRLHCGCCEVAELREGLMSYLPLRGVAARNHGGNLLPAGIKAGKCACKYRDDRRLWREHHGEFGSWAVEPPPRLTPKDCYRLPPAAD